MSEEAKPAEEFMEAAAEISMEWFDITPIAQTLADQYHRGFKAGVESAIPSKELLEREYQRGRDDYRDDLLKRMDAARGAPPAKSIEELPLKSAAAPQGAQEPASEGKVPTEPEKRPSPPPPPRVRPPRENIRGDTTAAPRPNGIPTTFEMLAQVIDKAPITAQEAVDHMRNRWWPRLEFKRISPEISTWVRIGRILRDADGRLTLSPDGRKLAFPAGFNPDGREKAPEPLKTEPIPEPPPKAPEQRVLPQTPVYAPMPPVQPTLGPRPTAHAGGSAFIHGGKTVLLDSRQLIVAQKLRAARGAGHLDAKFLAGQIGIKSDAEAVMREFVTDMNPRLATVGLVVEFFKGFGFIMKDLAQ